MANPVGRMLRRWMDPRRRIGPSSKIPAWVSDVLWSLAALLMIIFMFWIILNPRFK